ncbi:hypothetical protein LTR96_003457 [Exophiala xenobiotica]|nr:hypothetical protein LTR72_001377 [Exophiala xenobiotica]KAK5271632.1 hypothetical protein LTR96_003457 [Exophiala xenobiotica]KAK5295812.1 hypothetical protein LTR14_003440 [Exophiala xenobiotica]KAK5342868.1 hypothetical protein LTR98_000494 [Exophiala xenobiotica]KAK5492226.1 hypothetical protein LTR55_003578 [Exophiala xenobiotica]
MDQGESLHTSDSGRIRSPNIPPVTELGAEHRPATLPPSSVDEQPRSTRGGPDSDDPSQGGVTLAMIGARTYESHSQEFNDSSSAGSFIQYVRRVVEQKIAGTSAHTRAVLITLGQDNQPLMVPDEGIDHSHADYALPTRKRADNLVAAYWQYVHTLYPILGRRLTQADYESLWRGDGPSGHERSFLCLLNIMFALSSQITLTTPPRERQGLAAVFYDRAKKLLDLETTTSVRHVQILLLFGLYLQSTNEPHQCWIFVGLAVRTAQSLELHRPETSQRLSDTNARNLLRRVWHGCVLMDRVLAMTYGRPSMIGHRIAVSVPHPVAIEDEYLRPDPGTADVFPPGEKPTRIDFFIYSLTLYDILYDILVNLYSSETQHVQSLEDVYDRYFEASTPPGIQLTVLDVDRKLVEWKKRLPSYLQIGLDQNSHHHIALLHRQAAILHQRYLHVRLLSLRPVLSAFIAMDAYEREPHPSLQAVLSRRIIFQCSVVCVKVAQEAIEVVHKRLTEDAGAMGDLAAWWYNILFLYASATVLIAARLSPFILAELSEAAIFDSWRQAIEALDHYSVFGPPIQRLATTLRLLFDTVPRQFSRLRQQTGENGARTPRAGLVENMAPAMMHDERDSRVSGSRLPSPPPLESNWPESLLFATDEFFGSNTQFDLNDMSWLTTAPFEM